MSLRLPFLNTIFCWWDPTRCALSKLEQLRDLSGGPLPNLECVACLICHLELDPSVYDWCYIPVLSLKERLSLETNREEGKPLSIELMTSLCWERMDGAANGRRKVTAVRDSRRRKWSNV